MNILEARDIVLRAAGVPCDREELIRGMDIIQDLATERERQRCQGAMEKVFRIDEDGDIVGVKCGGKVGDAHIETKARISLEWLGDNFYEAAEWAYSEMRLRCTCGFVFPKDSYKWEWSGDWVLTLASECIEGDVPA